MKKPKFELQITNCDFCPFNHFVEDNWQCELFAFVHERHLVVDPSKEEPHQDCPMRDKRIALKLVSYKENLVEVE